MLGKSRKDKSRSAFRFSSFKMFFFFNPLILFRESMQVEMLSHGQCRWMQGVLSFDIYGRVVTHLLELSVLYNLPSANARFSNT